MSSIDEKRVQILGGIIEKIQVSSTVILNTLQSCKVTYLVM